MMDPPRRSLPRAADRIAMTGGDGGTGLDDSSSPSILAHPLPGVMEMPRPGARRADPGVPPGRLDAHARR